MSDELKLVFSTEKKVERKKKNNKQKDYKPSKGPIKIRMEKKGRGGKTVMVLYNIPLELKEAKALMKRLQSHLACGATFKNSVIELSGDNRKKIEEFLAKDFNTNSSI